MKRFSWPLQRLFNVTAQRERALRLELFALSQQAAAMRRDVLARKAKLAEQLDELGSLQIAQRIERQETVLKYAAVQRRSIEASEKKLADLQQLRDRKMKELMKARGSRKTLERLRDEAMQRHLLHEMRVEQKQFDESSHLRFSRHAPTR